MNSLCISFRAIYQVRHVHAIVVFYNSSAYGHAVSFGNVLRCDVVVADDRIDGIQPQNVEGVFFAGNRSFRGKSSMPVCPFEQVSYLGYPFAVYVLQGDAALTDDLAALLQYDCPQPEPVLAVPPQLVVQPCLRLFVRKGVF